MYKTSNPAFTNYFWDDDHDPSSKMTVRGIVFKSLVSMLISEDFTKALTIGKKERVARAGASSVFV